MSYMKQFYAELPQVVLAMVAGLLFIWFGIDTGGSGHIGAAIGVAIIIYYVRYLLDQHKMAAALDQYDEESAHYTISPPRHPIPKPRNYGSGPASHG